MLVAAEHSDSTGPYRPAFLDHFERKEQQKDADRAQKVRVWERTGCACRMCVC